MLKNLPVMQETLVQSLGREDPLEKEMTTTPVFSLGNPMDRGAWQATVYGVCKELDVKHEENDGISCSNSTCMIRVLTHSVPGESSHSSLWPAASRLIIM